MADLPPAPRSILRLISENIGQMADDMRAARKEAERLKQAGLDQGSIQKRAWRAIEAAADARKAALSAVRTQVGRAAKAKILPPVLAQPIGKLYQSISLGNEAKTETVAEATTPSNT